MSLNSCQQCGAEIEASASSCPKCGASTAIETETLQKQPRTSSAKTIVLILIALVGGAFIVWKFRQPSVPATAAQPVEKVDIPDLQAKAEGGDAEAQYKLGKAYAKGQGLPQSYADAAKWYRLAAEQSNAAAQTAMGELHEAGQGVPLDDAQAAAYYRKAAEQGYAPGQYNLAVLYVTGKGVQADSQEAIKWYRLAADQGDALAQFNLGMRFTEGKGVRPDPVEAYQWLTLAARTLPDSATARDGLAKSMSREQIAEGRKRAEAFVPKKPAPVQ